MHSKTGRIGRRRSFRPSMRLLTCVVASCFTAAEVFANPAGPTVVNGQVSFGGNSTHLTVTNSPGSIINWQSFSIAPNEITQFVQQSSLSAVLNRVTGVSPSLIQGMLQSNGQVYLINQNGILFDSGAQINVASLVASTLDINNSAFINGILTVNNGFNTTTLPPVFSLAAGAPTSCGSTACVQVNPGAQLSTPSGGRIMLLGPSVSNMGAISTPDGQTILGAGQNVYLAASTDPAMRGLLIEVNAGGTASNFGQITAQRGNVTVAGLVVNQAGNITATTSVTSNGSIYLVAGDTSATSAGATSQFFDSSVAGYGQLMANNGGALTLVSGSVTQVTPELSDTTTINGTQTFLPSVINLVGQSITMQGNSSVIAPSGNVSLLAATDPMTHILSASPYAHGQPLFDAPPDNARIYLDTGSIIDVSGTQNVQVPVTQNLIQIQLGSNELANAPLQRDGYLFEKTVTVDVNQGSPLIADLASYASNIGRTVGQLTVPGGTINLNSEGDIITRAGSTLNVSGGSIAYQSGYGTTTTLLGANGQLYGIGTAPVNIPYVAVADNYSYTDSKWGFTESWSYLNNMAGNYMAGYIQGGSAGEINLVAPEMVLQGTLIASITQGQFQRNASTLPTGGTFVIGDQSQQASATPDFVAPSIVLSDTDAALPADFTASSPPTSEEASQVVVSPTALSQGGFDIVKLYSQGIITLPVGSTLSLVGGNSLLYARGQSVGIAGDIYIPGGSVTLSSYISDTVLGPNAQINAAGNWVNDFQLTSESSSQPITIVGPVIINGGTVEMDSINNVILGAGSLIDVSGGGWYTQAKQLTDGSGGSVTLKANSSNSANGTVQLGGEISGYSLKNSGTLSVQAASVVIGGPGYGTAGELVVSPDFFNQGGFGTYSLTGSYGLTISSGASIAPVMQNLIPDWYFTLEPTGTNIFNFTNIGSLIQTKRSPVNIKLSTSAITIGQTPGTNLVMGTGASIVTDPGATVTLSARENLTVDGTIDAPAGTISLELSPNVLPGGSNDEGYVASQTLLLGPNARLLAPAYAEVLPNAQDLPEGQVLNGGQINLNASKGYIVTEAGSVMDVSGTSALIDILNPGNGTHSVTPSLVSGSAGAININAREGIVLAGSMTGNAAPVAGAAAGSLTIGLGIGLIGIDFQHEPCLADGTCVSGTPYILTDRNLILSSQSASALPSSTQEGVAEVSAPLLMAGGFDSINLESADIFTVSGAVNLSARQSLSVQAPMLVGNNGAVANLSAAYVAIGNSNGTIQPGLTNDGTFQPLTAGGTGEPIRTPLAGNAVLNVNADLIDIAGNSVLSGFANAVYTSSGDIRLTYSAAGTGGGNAVYSVASLETAGNLIFNAAQVYPTTLTQFTINPTINPDGSVAQYTPGNVTILANGATGNTPLSAVGSITINADEINQLGTLLAPLGQITLNASDTVTLGAGSLTSVSANGLTIPLGSTQNSTDWVYTVNNNAGVTVISSLPGKAITINGSKVVMNSGATADLSGGGDLYAYEFIAGPGGTSDVLAQNGQYQWAILPSLGSSYAPIDYQYSLGTNLQVGASIYLSGVPGLAAGYYPLLPAHYALLPGAFAVTPVSGYTDMTQGNVISETNGSFIVSGRLAVAGTDIISSRTAGYLVAPENVVRSQSQYTDSYANAFFTNAAITNGGPVTPLPADAGQLLIGGANTTSVSLNGTTEFALGQFNNTGIIQQGRGGEVAIVAPNIEIVDQLSANPPPQTLQLTASSLDELNSSILILGATPASTLSGEQLNVASSSVALNNSSNSPLIAPEIILVASQDISLGSASSIEGAGSLSNTAETLMVSGDGALLRVASGSLATLSRTNIPNAPIGTLTVNSGAVISGGSIMFDAANQTNISSSAEVSAAAVSFSSSLVSLGNPGVVQPGLNITPELLRQLNALTQLEVSSYSAIDFYGAVQLGALNTSTGIPTLQNVILNAGGLGGFKDASNNDVSVNVTASTIELANLNSVVANFPNNPTGTGSITLTATGNGTSGSGLVILGAGASTILGFSTANLNASGAIEGQASGALNILGNPALNIPGNLILQSAQISGTTGSVQEISATGTVNILQNNNNVSLSPPGVGAQLGITGSSIADTGWIDLPSGNLSLVATSGNVAIGQPASGPNSAIGAQIEAGGVAILFQDQIYASSPGGQVTLTANTGNVNIYSPSVINVAGAAVPGVAGSNSGTLSISAVNGSVQIDAGTLQGAAAAGQVGGNFSLDTASASVYNTGSATINGVLNSGGFDGQQTIRLRSGNVTIASSDVINASSYMLTVDNGSITVNGNININNENGGSVQLWAQNNLTLNSNPSSPTINAPGGSVTLGEASASGIIALGQNTINLANPAGNGGTALLRAQQNSNANSLVNIASTNLPNDIVGASEVGIEAFQTTNLGGITTTITTLTPYETTATNYMTAAHVNTVDGRLQISGNSVFNFFPGIELTDTCATCTVTLGSAAKPLNLFGVRYYDGATGNNDEPGILTVLAAGNLTITGALSDGFSGALTTANAADFTPQSGASWSYRLVAGADVSTSGLTGANPLATVPTTTGGNFTVSTATLVRTGKGNISIAAANNINLSSQTSVIYTAGVPATDVPTLLPIYDNYIGDATNKTHLLVTYTDEGGNVFLDAGGSIIGAASNEVLSNWLLHQGGTISGGINNVTSWGVAFDNFQEGVAALGGGNVTVQAGSNIINLSTEIPTTGWLNTSTDQTVIQGGGNLTIAAGGNIESGLFYVDHGNASISASGSITFAPSNAVVVYPILALAGGQIDVAALDDLTIETVLNPFILPEQVYKTATANEPVASKTQGYFYTYNNTDTVLLTSIAGNVNLQNSPQTIESAASSLSGLYTKAGTADNNDLTVYPPSLNVSALEGNVNVNGAFNLFPSPVGNLNLLAGQNIVFNSGVSMSEISPSQIANPLNPQFALNQANPYDVGQFSAPLPNVPLHLDDSQPIYIVALNGSIIDPQNGSVSSPLTFPKQVRIYAAENIENLDLNGKNINPTDVTSLEAGQNITFELATSSTTNQLLTNDVGVSVAGPGQVEILAGHNVDLGDSNGIVTTGSLSDVRLSSQGATLNVASGLGTNSDGSLRLPDTNDFITNYINSATGASLYSANLIAYMSQLTGQTLTYAQALISFLALPKNLQLPFVADVLYAQLAQTGIDHNTQGTDYSRGFNAIATLFPYSNYAGDVDMYFSQLKTEKGGDINLLVPGGIVDVGVPNPPAELNTLKIDTAVVPPVPAAGNLGVLVLAEGAIQGFASGDFDVNQSRMLTLEGGNIILWSSNGNIDAGKGARSASATPPPVIQTDASGNVVVNPGGSVSGSGIGQLLTNPNIVPGSVDLIAPNGDVNAGEAGIRVAGNLNIAAQAVLNVDNIHVTGISTGVPAASDAGALAGSLSGVGSLGDAAKSAADQLAHSLSNSASQQFLPTLLTVEVICMGGSCQ